MDYEEKVLDCRILGILKKDTACDLTYILETLKLPKTEIMKRIRYLCENKYLTFENGGFYITDRGCNIAVQPEAVSGCSEEQVDSGFDWKNSAYVPTPKSFSAGK